MATYLAKITGAVVITGAITLGTMTFWGGSHTIDNAISVIQEQANKLDIYGSNETKLVTKINELKGVRDDLLTQVEALTAKGTADEATIASLNQQITDANIEIASLEAQLATANSEITTANGNGETLTERIDLLEAELQKANADIERLQTELNNTDTSDNVPLTDSEMAVILEQ